MPDHLAVPDLIVSGVTFGLVWFVTAWGLSLPWRWFKRVIRT